MAWKVNKSCLDYAEKLIKDGKLVKESDWSESQATTDQENKFLKNEGWDAYAKWHLDIDSRENEETKERFGFPVGDFKKVHRSAIIAIKQRAGQYDYTDIVKAGDKLLSMIDKD
jgi:AAA15 family ATPase/GTPase